VIVPGLENQQTECFEYEKYKTNIFFYRPRDEISLLKIMSETRNKKKGKTIGDANTEDYVKNLHEFITRSL
jgi:hypothetical protein